jgi:hypothetical protein
MTLIDHEAVMHDFEDYILQENSHGQRFLLKKLAELRAQHRVVEGTPERVLRQYGENIYQAIRDSSSAGAPVPPEHDEDERESSMSEGGHNGRTESRS